MQNIYKKYGFFKEGIQTMTLKGADGVAQIQAIMDGFRANPPKKLGAYDVVSFRDYKKDTVLDLATGKVTPTGLPNSNVLYFDLTDDAWVCVRPSGTEPKIKFYIGVKGTDNADADAKLKALTDALMALA
jgi:phosphoglucomutase